ncbi:hypothetical protein QUA82_09840 [Microcoleus sp. F8-D3]
MWGSARPNFPQCPSFFESDPEYPDLDSRNLAAKRYLRLIYSADYRSTPFMDDDPDREGLPSPTNNLPLPTNVVTIGRRVTPSLRIKILRALEVFPTKGQIRVYQLFAEVKFLGYRYDIKKKNWEFYENQKNRLRAGFCT